jgi:uncharacterized protein with FMN-binding domain
MRRTVKTRVALTFGSTVAGMSALLAMKFQASPSVPLAAQTAPSGAVAGTGHAAGAAAPASGGTASSGTASGGHATGSTAKSPAGKQGGSGKSAGTRVVSGSTASTAYGPMQVQVTATGGRITSVTALQQTDVGSYSGQVDSQAIPQLDKEAIVAQSAKIHAVTGASYTSQGYIQSLQSALDQLRA